MPVAADALQPHLASGLMTLAGRRGKDNFPDILLPSNKTGYDLDFDNMGQTISADFRQSDLVSAAIGSDCSRFACAAFQSIAPVSREIRDRDTIAWSLVKLYYSSFYAGHSVMRMLGESCSYFDGSHVGSLTELFSILGKTPGFGIERGLYHCSLNGTCTGLTAKRASGLGGGGGTHEIFWKLVGGRISRLSEEVLSGPLASNDARTVFAKLTDFMAILSRRGVRQHTWLTSIRNELQYQHKLEVWFPAGIRASEREALGRLSSQWGRDPMMVDLGAGGPGSLREFVSACVFVVALCLEMLLRILERSSVGTQSFARLGPIAFLHDARLIQTQGNLVTTMPEQLLNA
jgi:hypothetical protein